MDYADTYDGYAAQGIPQIDAEIVKMRIHPGRRDHLRCLRKRFRRFEADGSAIETDQL